MTETRWAQRVITRRWTGQRKLNRFNAWMNIALQVIPAFVNTHIELLTHLFSDAEQEERTA